MASSSEAQRLCPFCAEEIKSAAIVCKHCGRDVPLNVVEDATENQLDTDLPTGNVTFEPARCWNCGASDQKSAGWCTWCGVDLAKPLNFDEVPPRADDASGANVGSAFKKSWKLMAVIAALLLLILIVANSVKPGQKSAGADSYPVASTVREAVAYSIANYCPQAPSAIGEPNNWMSMGGNAAFINTSGGRVTLQASKPGSDGTPGEVTAADSLSQAALDAWGCRTPMFVQAAGD